jgi:cytidylate kinase
MKQGLLIAIDGPSASGKGTIAKALAEHFNQPYLNTGALYRLIAYQMMQAKITLQNLENHLDNFIKNITTEKLENENLFSEEVGEVASTIAQNHLLRKNLFDFQRDFALRGKHQFGGAVLDGRDIATVICPDADYKFFITADVEIRAQRRFAQQQKKSYDEILLQLKNRDENDINRSDSPLKIAPNAIIIDNSKLSVAESFRMVSCHFQFNLKIF